MCGLMQIYPEPLILGLGSWTWVGPAAAGAGAGLPTALMAWKLGPRPKGAMAGLMWASAVAVWPLAFLVLWQRLAPDLDLTSFATALVGDVVIRTEEKMLGVVTSVSEVPATTALLRARAGAAMAGGAVMLALPYLRKGCPTCGGPIELRRLGWTPWDADSEANPLDAYRAAAQAWRAAPSRLQTGTAPPGQGFLSFHLHRCPHGHDGPLLVRGVRAPGLTLPEQPLGTLTAAEQAGLEQEVGAGAGQPQGS